MVHVPHHWLCTMTLPGQRVPPPSLCDALTVSSGHFVGISWAYAWFTHFARVVAWASLPWACQGGANYHRCTPPLAMQHHLFR